MTDTCPHTFTWRLEMRPFFLNPGSFKLNLWRSCTPYSAYLSLPMSIITLSTEHDVNMHTASTGVLLPRRLCIRLLLASQTEFLS
jgi:hypothetical protein